MRNDIYSALLSGSGIRTIEATLEHELQATGWIADLKAYITQLLRSGECTTVAELNAKVREKIKLGADGGAAEAEGNRSRENESENGNESGNEKANGNGLTNGTSNGNGINGNGTHTSTSEFDLRLPERAVREGVRVVRRELDKVCEITVVEADDK
ncbi:hypothetical protein K505DRAFT_261480 [Melanomma pulvis-pyrius CBS 109.77]|uniref:Uncharacterized protein n=1 Tax=Melanomma pulvis-pyrius CBS 109.77 TaxID=1314802 RepID=A0A6A6WNQ6_9PLEO|nr:hypothetical protein K505DRAFT_261480 [Melanomma pulvis-pyrius CBS 109.77]